MLTLRVMLVIQFLLLLATACAPVAAAPTPGAPTLDLGQIVQATLQAMTAQATVVSPTATPVPSTAVHTTGSISGSLNYPADSLPAMHVVAYRVGTDDYQYVTTQPGQGKYRIGNVPPGTYHVIAYTVGGGSFPAGFAGGYTRAVPCGMAAECADHSLLDVAVSVGQDVADVNVFDWYGAPGAFPPFPGQTIVPTATQSAEVGGIAGALMYPASALPALRIVAFQVGSSGHFYTETAPGQSTFHLENLPPGTYHVVAYVLPGAGFTGAISGGYSQMVPCGLKAGCNDHALIDVLVTAGHVTTGVNPNDYYADAGTFPADPVP